MTSVRQKLRKYGIQMNLLSSGAYHLKKWDFCIFSRQNHLVVIVGSVLGVEVQWFEYTEHNRSIGAQTLHRSTK